MYYAHLYSIRILMYITHMSITYMLYTYCVCTLTYVSVNTSIVRLTATVPQKETKTNSKQFSPSFPWSIKKESGVIEWKQNICFLTKHLRSKRRALLVFQLSPNYGYFSMVQNTLIIVLGTMDVNNVFNPGWEFTIIQRKHLCNDLNNDLASTSCLHPNPLLPRK